MFLHRNTPELFRAHKFSGRPTPEFVSRLSTRLQRQPVNLSPVFADSNATQDATNLLEDLSDDSSLLSKRLKRVYSELPLRTTGWLFVWR